MSKKSENMPYDIIKSHKKTGLHPLPRSHIFEKTTKGDQFELHPPQSFKLLRVNFLKQLHFWNKH